MEQKIKQRLVGAIVLISLAVIFIPIILEGPDDEWTTRSHSIPEPPQMDYGVPPEVPMPVRETAPVTPVPVPVPTLAEPEPAAQAEAAAKAEAAQAEAALQAEADEAAARAEAKAAEVEAEQTDAAATPVTAVPAKADTPSQLAKNATAALPKVTSQPNRTEELPAGGWVIQVGSFSSESNASSLRDRLKSSGYDAFLQDVAVGKGRTYRVVVGPLQGRKAAEQLRDQLAKQMQLRGIVVENKG